MRGGKPATQPIAALSDTGVVAVAANAAPVVSPRRQRASLGAMVVAPMRWIPWTTGLDPIGRIWALIGMSQPSLDGRGVGGVAFGAANGPTTANTGDHLVAMRVNGKTLKQFFCVE